MLFIQFPKGHMPTDEGIFMAASLLMKPAGNNHLLEFNPVLEGIIQGKGDF